MALPVLGLQSNRGKLLLEISSLILWPFMKTMLVGQSSIDICWGALRKSMGELYRRLIIPSQILKACPFPYTSTSLAVKSVHCCVVVTYKIAFTGPVTSVSLVSTALV